MAGKKSEKSGKGPAVYSLTQRDDHPEALDARLREIVEVRDDGTEQDPMFVWQADDGSELVDVVARLVDEDAEVPGVTFITRAGRIATARIEVSELERVAAHDSVVRLERGRKVHSDLLDSLPDIRASAEDLQRFHSLAGPIDGSNTIVGIIDFGCDFLHENFRDESGKTRILALWDQDGTPSASDPAPGPFNYGREFTQARINEALTHATPRIPSHHPSFPEDGNNGAYRHLHYRPSVPGRPSAHGTHVMDIAAGNGLGSGVPGVAPRAGIIFVQLGEAGSDPDDHSLGDSIRLLHAVHYIFQKAEDLGLPAVVNMSLGTHGGPKDGSTPVEQAFDALLQEPGRAIVISAGNSWRRRSHASGVVTAANSRSVQWEIASTDRTTNEVEVWYPGDTELELVLVDPAGARLGPVSLGIAGRIEANGRPIGSVRHHTHSESNQDNHIDILLKRGGVGAEAPSGTWQVLLTTSGDAEIPFDLWIERDRPRHQSAVSLGDEDRSRTLGSISCGRNTIVVGSYNARAPSNPVSSFSSEGPTRDGREKPELSAPGGEIGEGVDAARSLTRDRTTKMAGTSMAAPHVTGAVALLFQSAGRPLTVAEIRQALAQGARPNDSGEAWDPRQGVGRLDVVDSIAQVAMPSEPHALELCEGRSASSSPPPPEVGLAGLAEQLASVASTQRARVELRLTIEPSGEGDHFPEPGSDFEAEPQPEPSGGAGIPLVERLALRLFSVTAEGGVSLLGVKVDGNLIPLRKSGIKWVGQRVLPVRGRSALVYVRAVSAGAALLEVTVSSGSHKVGFRRVVDRVYSDTKALRI